MKDYIREWPKWVTARCPKCGTVVPRGNEHVCPTVEKSNGDPDRVKELK
jgi:hypothetical protein